MLVFNFPDSTCSSQCDYIHASDFNLFNNYKFKETFNLKRIFKLVFSAKAGYFLYFLIIATIFSLGMITSIHFQHSSLMLLFAPLFVILAFLRLNIGAQIYKKANTMQVKSMKRN